MRNQIIAAFAALSCAVAAAESVKPSGPCAFVDPFIGTAGTGHTTPAACVPFGLVQAGPDTGNGDWEHCSGYSYGDKTIHGFSQTHLNGTGCPDLGDVRILPFVSESAPESVPYDKASESAKPGFYAVTLAGGVKVEISATARCAIYRLSYPKGARCRLLVDPRWCITRGRTPGSCIQFCDVAPDGKTGVS